MPTLLVNTQAQENAEVGNHGTRDQRAVRNPFMMRGPIMAKENCNYCSRQYRPAKI